MYSQRRRHFRCTPAQKETLMASNNRLVITPLFITLVLSLSLLAATDPCRDQAASPTDDAYLAVTNGVNPTAVPALAITGQPSTADTSSGAHQNGLAAPDYAK